MKFWKLSRNRIKVPAMAETTTTQGPSPAEIAARLKLELIATVGALGITVLLILLVFAVVFTKTTPDATTIGIVMAVVTPSMLLVGAAFIYIFRVKSTSQTGTTTGPGPATSLTVERA